MSQPVQRKNPRNRCVSRSGIENGCTNGDKTGLSHSRKGMSIPLLSERIYMSINKHCFELLSVIYSLQSSVIAY